jgi:ribosome modulation factor
MTYPTPREHGYIAYGRGHTLTACPYDYNSEAGIQWVEGWYKARSDFQSAFTL